MGDIAQQQGDVMSENSIPVVAYWFTSIRRLIICNDVECAKRTTRPVAVDHTVDVIFDHPQWPTYWLIIGRRRSSICECCPDKETIDVGSSTPGFAVGTLIVSLGRGNINCVDQTTWSLHRQRMCRAEHVRTDMPGITQPRRFFSDDTGGCQTRSVACHQTSGQCEEASVYNRRWLHKGFGHTQQHRSSDSRLSPRASNVSKHSDQSRVQCWQLQCHPNWRRINFFNKFRR